MVLQQFLEVEWYYPQYDSNPSVHMTLTGGEIASLTSYSYTQLNFSALQ